MPSSSDLPRDTPSLNARGRVAPSVRAITVVCVPSPRAYFVPRPRSRTVADVMNDHFVVPDFIHDQILANRKSQEAGLPLRSPDMRRSRNPLRRAFNTRDHAPGGLPIVRSYECKNLIEVGKCAALISQLH